jgi:hypothetical protein
MPKNLPATVAEELKEGSPMQRLLGETLEELGGVDFMVNWAEDYPGDFVRVLLAVSNAGARNAPAAGNTNVINVHPALAPGPLDEKVVSNQ